MPLRVLFVDMNSFFAAVEQQRRPELRGRPVAVVAVDVGTTSCIAVSQEAKRLGIRRGMPVWQAKQQCKSLKVVESRTEVYVETHHQVVAAVDSCLPVHSVHSIDEMSCRLAPNQRSLQAAIDLAHQVKRAIYERAGVCLHCSIGLAPNRFLAKIASGLQKPDGLIVIQDEHLPEVLYPLELIDLPGIGRRMLARLNRSGIGTIRQLFGLTEGQMKELWGGVVGQRWWYWLRGHDLPEPRTRRSTIGHSHVLPPALRTEPGARGVILRLIHKAAARLRRLEYWARRMEVSVSSSFHEAVWSQSVPLGLCQDTLTMIEAFHQLWKQSPRSLQPTQVGVTLSHLVPACSAGQSLFPSEQRRVHLSRTMDQLNQKFGANTIYFGGILGVQNTAPTRIAFTQIPDYLDETG